LFRWSANFDRIFNWFLKSPFNKIKLENWIKLKTILYLIVLVPVVLALEYGYGESYGPEQWGECSGRHHSPLTIDLVNAQPARYPSSSIMQHLAQRLSTVPPSVQRGLLNPLGSAHCDFKCLARALFVYLSFKTCKRFYVMILIF